MLNSCKGRAASCDCAGNNNLIFNQFGIELFYFQVCLRLLSELIRGLYIYHQITSGAFGFLMKKCYVSVLISVLKLSG